MHRLKLHELRPDVYAVLGAGTMPNAAFIVTGVGVVAVDSLYSGLYAREFLELIRQVTDAPIVAGINTHHHADHVFGNATVAAPRIIAHERAYMQLAAIADGYVELVRSRRPDLADELVGLELRLPDETFEDRLTLRLGEHEIRLVHYGRVAHTEGDVVVHVGDVTLAGDLVFNGVLPPMRDGDIDGLKRTLEQARDHSAARWVVAGHGPVGDAGAWDDQLSLIELITAAVGEVVAAGGAATEAVELVTHRLGEQWLAPERVSEWVSRALTDLTDKSNDEK